MHFGLINGIIRILDFSDSVLQTELKLQVSVDGIPISFSSSKELWPILGFISDSGCEPFEIGIYCGKEKPKDVSSYLRFLIEDLSVEGWHSLQK